MRPQHVSCLFALFLSSLCLRGEQMVQLSAESLSGKEVLLPEAVTGRIAIFCIGFSHESQSQVKRWSERTQTQFVNNPQVVVYSVAVLEDAPKLVRGMIVHAIKTGVPTGRRDRFLILYHNEQQLKRVTGFERSDAAYLLLIDRRGEIRWRHGGESGDAAEADLDKHVRELLEAH
jgi:hypothetical protein